MLWSLLKIVLFVVIVAAIAYGATWLLEADQGGLRLTWAGYEANLGPLQTVIALVILLALAWLLFKTVAFLVATLRFINGDDTAISRYWGRRSERRGFDALSEGMMALASGDGREALSKASRADRYLNKPELTNLLTAQAAEMVGDRQKAERAYKALLTDERTRFVGIRGIMKQKLAEGDTDTALKLAEKAFAIRPKHEETQDTLLRLQTGGKRWTDARRTLNAKLKSGTMPRDLHKRRDAVLALAEAKGVFDEEGTIETREAAIEANRLSPDLIPAAVLAAKTYVEQGKPKYAARVIQKAWESQPHPDLAAAFAAIQPDEDASARRKRFRPLLDRHPEHAETKLLRAELAIAAEDFPGARRALGDLATTHPDARAMTLMAAIERGEGADDNVVRAWLARALTAPRGPQWVCGNCHNIHGGWVPVCENCGAFDTLAWEEPPAAEAQLPGGVDMLPLLVGPARAVDRPAQPDLTVPATVTGEIVDPPLANGADPGVIMPAAETPADVAEKVDRQTH